MRSEKERRPILPKGGMPGLKGPTNYARFVAFYSGRVFGQAPGFNPGSVITNFWVRMARRLGTVPVYAILCRLLPRRRRR